MKIKNSASIVHIMYLSTLLFSCVEKFDGPNTTIYSETRHAKLLFGIDSSLFTSNCDSVKLIFDDKYIGTFMNPSNTHFFNCYNSNGIKISRLTLGQHNYSVHCTGRTSYTIPINITDTTCHGILLSSEILHPIAPKPKLPTLVVYAKEHEIDSCGGAVIIKYEGEIDTIFRAASNEILSSPCDTTIEYWSESLAEFSVGLTGSFFIYSSCINEPDNEHLNVSLLRGDSCTLVPIRY